MTMPNVKLERTNLDVVKYRVSPYHHVALKT